MLLFVVICRLLLLFWLVLLQPDTSAAISSELKYAYSKSFKKYLFEFKNNSISYRKEKVICVQCLHWLVVELNCIWEQDLTTYATF